MRSSLCSCARERDRSRGTSQAPGICPVSTSSTPTFATRAIRRAVLPPGRVTGDYAARPPACLTYIRRPSERRTCATNTTAGNFSICPEA